MNASVKKLFLPPALLTGLALMLAGQAAAQIFTTLYNFSADNFPSYTNSDGSNPNASLILSGNSLYGTAEFGGNTGGTVFALDTNDFDFTTVWLFTSSEGIAPVSTLTLLGNTLFGTVWEGGGAATGAVFSLQTNGGPYTAIHNFTSLSASEGTYGTNSDGGYPYASLILSGNTLYGTAFVGGGLGWGTVFAVNTDSTGFTNLHSFTGGSDGANPYAGLILSGNTLYGTTSGGFFSTAQSGFGTVFAINTNGSDFTTLYSFTNGSDGANPYAGLILSGTTLYGMAYAGGSSAWGTVFALDTNSFDFTTLYSFTNGSDGSQPWAGLTLSNNTLYGTASRGGNANGGTAFSVSTDGSIFTTLHSFTKATADGNTPYPNYTNSDGNSPLGGLLLSGNTLYGTAEQGGTNGRGTVFSITLPSVGAPLLTITASGTNVILTWPTGVTGFTLQSITNLVSPAAWSAVSPAPVVVNGQFTVTNSVSETQMFYRLSQ
jgi:uncharacterized repeat protein (TIGR03803 family)